MGLGVVLAFAWQSMIISLFGTIITLKSSAYIVCHTKTLQMPETIYL